MFLLMWLTTVVDMMFPSLIPMLHRDRNALAGLERLTTLVGAGYFFVRTLFGIAAFHLRRVLPRLVRGGRRSAPSVWFYALLCTDRDRSVCLY